MKKRLWQVIISLIVFVAALLVDEGIIDLGIEYLVLVLFIISYIIVGRNVALTAIKNISRGQIFDENFLMSIATIGAF